MGQGAESSPPGGGAPSAPARRSPPRVRKPARPGPRAHDVPPPNSDVRATTLQRSSTVNASDRRSLTARRGARANYARPSLLLGGRSNSAVVPSCDCRLGRQRGAERPLERDRPVHAEGGAQRLGDGGSRWSSVAIAEGRHGGAAASASLRKRRARARGGAGAHTRRRRAYAAGAAGPAQWRFRGSSQRAPRRHHLGRPRSCDGRRGVP